MANMDTTGWTNTLFALRFIFRWCSRFWKHVLWVSLIFCLIECRNSTNNKKFISLSLMANQPRSLFAYLLYSFQTSFYIKNCRISQVSNSHRQRRTRSTLTARPTTSRCWEKVIKFFWNLPKSSHGHFVLKVMNFKIAKKVLKSLGSFCKKISC